jgi:hypothetical protein
VQEIEPQEKQVEQEEDEVEGSVSPDGGYLLIDEDGGGNDNGGGVGNGGDDDNGGDDNGGDGGDGTEAVEAEAVEGGGEGDDHEGGGGDEVMDDDEEVVESSQQAANYSDNTLTKHCLGSTVAVKIEKNMPVQAPFPLFPDEVTHRNIVPARGGALKKPAPRLLPIAMTSDDATTSSNPSDPSWSGAERDRVRMQRLNPPNKPGTVVNRIAKSLPKKDKIAVEPSPSKSISTVVGDSGKKNVSFDFSTPHSPASSSAGATKPLIMDVTATRQNVRKNLFAMKDSVDPDQLSPEELVGKVMEKLISMHNDINQLQAELHVQTMLSPRDNRFLVIPGNCDLMDQLLQTVHRMVDFPFRSVKQLGFQKRILNEFPCYRLIIDIYLSNTTAGGGCFATCNNVWYKVFSNRLSRDIAWAAIGESEEKEEGAGRTKGLGRDRKEFFQLKSQAPQLRDLLTRMYNHQFIIVHFVNNC